MWLSQPMLKTLFVDTPYHPKAGCYAKIKKVHNGRYETDQWHRCRDLWHYKLKGLSLFFFSHELDKTQAIIDFMNQVEEKLQVAPKSLYGPTQRRNICWVEPSTWWIKCGMRRSLYTILLRCAQYYEDNFEETLFYHKYMKDTEFAVRRFFAGFTTYAAKRRGWHKQFSKLSSKEIEDLLIRKDK